MSFGVKTNCWQQDIRSKEYILAGVKGILLTTMIAWLFYDSWLAVIGLTPVWVFYLRGWSVEHGRQKELFFREQFKDSMQAMSAALNVGYSVENAIRETMSDLQQLYPNDSRILKEFRQMIYRLDMNQTAEQALQEFMENVGQEDVRNFVIVFSAAKRMGGDSISVMQGASKAISEKMEVEREIQTMLTGKKMEFQIMCVIPFGIIFYMRTAFPEFMQVLYGSALGAGIMTGCLGIYLVAYQIGKKIISIEV